MANRDSCLKHLSIAVTGICECCSEVEASPDALLQHFTDDLPAKGAPHGLRIVLSRSAADEDQVVDDALANHLHRVVATGAGHVDHDGRIVLPGVLPYASG